MNRLYISDVSNPRISETELEFVDEGVISPSSTVGLPDAVHVNSIPNRLTGKMAIVHDYLAQSGGAERVVAALAELFPDAPIYTSVYDPSATLKSFRDADVKTSFLQGGPLASRRLHKLALPFYPAAFEQFDFTGCDVVVSSSSSFAKGVITGPETCHICYCHTPARFAWRHHEYISRGGAANLLAPLMRGMLSQLRQWDFDSAQRVDYFVANSQNVARRIRKYYRREPSAVIYPPVETRRFAPAPANEIGDHYLVVGRLVGYKRTDLAIKACNRLNAPLRIVGAGPDEKALRRIAGPTIRFLGKLSDEDVAHEMARCRALIFPGEEDFGITPLEVMASGSPVVAFGAGGALETVIDGETGILFADQAVDSLCGALIAVSQSQFASGLLEAHAHKFSSQAFRTAMRRFVDAAAEHHQRLIPVVDQFVDRQVTDKPFRLRNAEE